MNFYLEIFNKVLLKTGISTLAEIEIDNKCKMIIKDDKLIVRIDKSLQDSGWMIIIILYIILPLFFIEFLIINEFNLWDLVYFMLISMLITAFMIYWSRNKYGSIPSIYLYVILLLVPGVFFMFASIIMLFNPFLAVIIVIIFLTILIDIWLGGFMFHLINRNTILEYEFDKNSEIISIKKGIVKKNYMRLTVRDRNNRRLKEKVQVVRKIPKKLKILKKIQLQNLKTIKSGSLPTWISLNVFWVYLIYDSKLKREKKLMIFKTNDLSVANKLRDLLIESLEKEIKFPTSSSINK